MITNKYSGDFHHSKFFAFGTVVPVCACLSDLLSKVDTLSFHI